MKKLLTGFLVLSVLSLQAQKTGNARPTYKTKSTTGKKVTAPAP
ncbi:MAG: hypothetical protein K0Q66_794, partial [Chitinophagaceae bacterium]|nr:hypothetical protein [Chitinophagaceae bacterium]